MPFGTCRLGWTRMQAGRASRHPSLAKLVYRAYTSLFEAATFEGQVRRIRGISCKAGCAMLSVS
eukprot:CAMPEP_0181424810 /NCGR_PEP_ID=MMETSP1110-20121109/14837_1 /TAXON_ID=174948 /ORGANISM="Symbiodinium sp., Strain CCMP421" /LENGTH=63 /DNA_ID=CAMNT_0023547981 /DNA_START=417 /DNA_END=608 /DNA_ORIENTATION=-